MEQISITKKDTGAAIKLFAKEPFCTVKSATQEKNLMGDDTVKLQVVSSQLINFNKGDFTTIDGEVYTMRTKATRQLVSDRYYVYDITLYGVMYELMNCLYRDTDVNGKSSSSTFDLTYTLKEFARVIIYNMRRDYPGKWVLDESSIPDTEPITLNFSNQNCLQVLQSLCSEDNFKVDFQITQANNVRTLHIGKFGSVITPPGGQSAFEWGQGKGIYDLKEEKVDDKTIKTRLWVEGGSSNLKSGYRNYSDKLQLPYPRRRNQYSHVLRDGTTVGVGTQTIGLTDDSKRYHEDAALAAKIGSDEDEKTYDKIFPKHTGTVSALGKDIYTFVDSSMDFDLSKKNANKETVYLISGVSAKITFISGKLAGQEFELKSYDHATKTFVINPYQDNRGLKFPTEGNTAYRMAVGDKFKITDINPSDAMLAKAEEDLWYESIQDFQELTQPRVKYSLTLDRMYMLDNTSESASPVIFKPGDYVHLKDARFGVDKSIRITKVTRNLLVRQDYAITLSDTVSISVATQTVIDVQEHEIIIEANRLRDLTRAKRAWRTTEELRNMVYDTDGYFDPENIKPNSIDTNMLTVGSKSQQFVLTGCILQPNFGGNCNVFQAGAGTLSHLTINEDSIRSWTLESSKITLAYNDQGYYLFAKCPKSGDKAVWYMTTQKLLVENASDPNNYYFQIGILSTAYDGVFRDFVTTYGFTRINGNTITTGRIVTSDGACYLDLDGNKFRMGDDASFIKYEERQVTLHNVRLLSESGSTAPIGVYRGVYSSSEKYYYGDEVSYTSDGATKTYRHTSKTSTTNVPPTNTGYWTVIASGKDGNQGKDGNFVEYRYKVTGSPVDLPSLNDTADEPEGWSLTQPTVGTLQYLWRTFAQKSGETGKLLPGVKWSKPVRETAKDGVNADFHKLVVQGTNGSRMPKIVLDGKEISPASTYPTGLCLTVINAASWNIVYQNGTTLSESSMISNLHSKADGTAYIVIIVSNGNYSIKDLGNILKLSYGLSEDISTGGLNTSRSMCFVGCFGLQPGQAYYVSGSGALSELVASVSNGILIPQGASSYGSGANILKSTDFARLKEWYYHDGYAVNDCIDGVPGFLCMQKSSSYTDSLTQLLIKKGSDGFTRLSPDCWYTLSFWAKRAPQPFLVNETSNVYGFGLKTIYLTAGVKVRFRVFGHIDQTALSTGKSLKAYLFYDNDSGWLDSAQTEEITSLTDIYSEWVEFTPKYSTTYKMRSYLYENGGDRTGKATCVRYEIDWLSDCEFDTYIHPNAVNTGIDMIKDGEAMSGSPSDLRAIWKATSVWTKHTLVFKTALAFNSNTFIRFRFYATYKNQAYICMPKLERGTVATAWSLAESDKVGADAANIFPLYRSEYNASTTYYGTTSRVDIVKYNGVYYIARTDAGEFSGVVPTDTSKWNYFGAQFESVATQIFLAEFAYIENLGVHDLLTNQSGKRVHISSDNNSVSIYDGNGDNCITMEGENYTDEQLFGGAEATIDSFDNTNQMSFQTGNALHPDNDYTSGKIKVKSFTFNSAGTISGSVMLYIESSGNINMPSTPSMTRPFSADLVLYIDNTSVGAVRIGELGTHSSHIVRISHSIVAGDHTISYRVHVSNPKYADGTSYSVSVKVTTPGLKVMAAVRMSRYFANGMAVGCASNQYVETLMDTNNKLIHRILSGNAGMLIQDGVMKIRIGGAWYTVSRDGSGFMKLTEDVLGVKSSP